MVDRVAKAPGRRGAAKRLGGDVLQDIRQKILKGALRAGDRVPSARELQERYNVPYRAARFALQRLEREGLVTCRIGAGTYVNEEICDGVPAPRTKVIEVIFDCQRDSPHTAAFLGPLVEAVKKELDLLDAECGDVIKLDNVQARDRMNKGGADAFVWVSPRLKHGIPLPVEAPLVLVGQNLDVAWHQSEGYDVVGPDDVQGGALAARYLRELGCRRVAIVAAGERDNATRPHVVSARRVHGFESAWGEPLRGNILLADCGVAQGGAAKLEEFLVLDPLPEAVFAASDDLAFGFCHGLIAHGMRAGRDVKVVGFDGQPPRYEGDTPLTTVRVPLEEMGRAAAHLAVERAAEPDRPARKLHVACRLRKGETA